MPSPFPGMDPYLEGYLWPDVHHRLATEISKQLMPGLRPRYVARIEVQVVQDDTAAGGVTVMYPDVEIVTSHRRNDLPTRLPTAGGVLVAEAPAITPVTISLPEVRLKTVEIRDTANNELVTSIEILSPVNKRGKGLNKYSEKRDRLRKAGVHLLEIDFLRRGKRLFSQPSLPKRAYSVTLIRGHATSAKLWPIKLQDALPVVPVPLRDPDADLALDLAAVLKTIYQEAAYDLSIDYTRPAPSPSLTAEEEEWLDQQLKKVGITRD